MAYNKKPLGPRPSIILDDQVAQNILGPWSFGISGELTFDPGEAVVASPQCAGRISNVFVSVLASGKDDSNTLRLAADVKINGTSCLTTQPYVSHVSGEASQQKTTFTDDDTGVVQCVLDYDNNIFNPGDIITIEPTVTRTASPTTEMKSAVITVEAQPYRNK